MLTLYFCICCGAASLRKMFLHKGQTIEYWWNETFE